MASPASFENTVRLHDSAFYEWLGNLRVDYGASSDLHPDMPQADVYPTRDNFPILRVFASPQRAFATVVDRLVHQGWVTTDTAEAMRTSADRFAVLPLPVATIERGDPVPDTITASVPKRFARAWFNPTTGNWEGHPWPAVYLTPYTVTFWSEKRYTEAFLREWILSQLGLLGAGDRELFLPITHADPWGVKLQSLTLDSFSDQSDLEGDNPRYIRFEASFQLRTLHMRPLQDADIHPPINLACVPVRMLLDTDGVTTDPFDRDPDLPAISVQSDNLFTRYYTRKEDVASKWPKSGDATVAWSPLVPDGRVLGDPLRAVVRSVTDRVGIVERTVNLDGGFGIVSVALRYRATQEVSLAIHQRPGGDPPVWTRARTVRLPATSGWTSVQVFAVVDAAFLSVVLEGRAITSVVDFLDVDVRNVLGGTAIDPTGSSTGFGGGTKFTWSGLTQGRSYLVMVLPSSASGSWSIRTQDDDTSPDFILSRTFSAADETGYVEILSPKSASIAVTLPVGFAASDVVLVPYGAGFRGRLPA